jgi:GH15 family glucan-1,4-alpha-glucosidase
MCWVALDRAVRLTERGELPRRHAGRWKREAAAIEAYVETECWSDALGSYTRTAGDTRVDASLLMLPLMDRKDAPSNRISGTVDAVMCVPRAPPRGPKHPARHPARSTRHRAPAL